MGASVGPSLRLFPPVRRKKLPKSAIFGVLPRSVARIDFFLGEGVRNPQNVDLFEHKKYTS